MLNRFYLVFLILFITGSSRLCAGQTRISGFVSDSAKPIPAATVSLLNGGDSSWVKSVITNDSGLFVFDSIAPGKYLVSITATGYETKLQNFIVKINEDLVCKVTLQKLSNSLKEVSVTAKKPFIEMSLGKLTVNIEGTATTAAATALDLMRRLPGVSVDQNGAITMTGKSGVLVLIDGRTTYLSGDDLAAYLRTITADEIGQIELITQPGARYDASGNTGIINIKLKKNKKPGISGSAALTLGEGVYFHRNESFRLNYKVKRLNISLSCSDMGATGFADYEETIHYTSIPPIKVTGMSSVNSNIRENFNNSALRCSGDYEYSEKTSAGINLRVTYHPNTNSGTTFLNTTDQTSGNINYNNISSPDGFIRKDIMGNAWMTHKFNKKTNLEINFDYLTFHKNEYQEITNISFNSQMQPLPLPFMQNSSQFTSINVYSIKTDLSTTLKNGINLEAGIKSSWTATDNTGIYSLFENNTWVNDTGMTNRFTYKENINAGYISGTRNFGGKWVVRIGIRTEQTITDGVQYVYYNHSERNYFSLFPTAFLTYKLDSFNQFELNYGRRIDRPLYTQLNPFSFYAYNYTYTFGNPYLQPQFTHNIELKHSYRNMIITSFSCSTTGGEISNLTLYNDTTHLVYNTSINQGTSDFYKFSVIFNKPLFKWWEFNASGSMYYSYFTGLLNNVTRKVSGNGYSLNTNSQFDFGKGWKSEVYAYYNSGGVISITEAYGPSIYMELGFSKKINDRLLLKCTAADPLFIYRLENNTQSDNFHSNSTTRFATMLYSISLTLNFGGKQKGPARDLNVEEANRIKMN